jgi:capsular exopolysaccharide synthesis family protein
LTPQDGEHTLELEYVLGVLRRRAPLIALCVVLVAGVAFVFSKRQTKHYKATASLVFNNNALNQQVAGLTAAGNGSPQAEQSTNVKLVELGDTAARTAGRLGKGLTGNYIKDSLNVSAEGESNIVSVTATATSPRLASDIANTYASQFVKDQGSADRRYFSSALALLQKQLAALSRSQRLAPEGVGLQDRAQSLEILAQLQFGNVQIAQAAASPSSPSSPNVRRNTVLGAVLGLLLGLALAALLERLDRRIKEPDDLERIFGLPLLGVIPERPAYARDASGDRHEDPAPPGSGEMEVFCMLRSRLRYFNIDRDLRLVLVTSAASGDGKTTIVQNLAQAAASMGSSVLVIESDLRRPSLAQRLALRPLPGLAEVLISSSTVDHAIQTTWALPPSNDFARGSTMSVLTAGSPPPNPAELIESHTMEQLLEWATENYDLVLVDAPPLSVVPDAIPLLRRVHGVLIVGRLGKSTRDGAARMRDELTSLGAPMLGVVANGCEPRDSAGYGYEYYYAPAEPNRPRAEPAQAPEPEWDRPRAEPAQSIEPEQEPPAGAPARSPGLWAEAHLSGIATREVTRSRRARAADDA